MGKLKLIKNRIIYLFTSNAGRIILGGVLILLGGILGTEGLLERKNQNEFWDYIVYLGALIWLVYIVVGFYYAFKNLINDLRGK